MLRVVPLSVRLAAFHEEQRDWHDRDLVLLDRGDDLRLGLRQHLARVLDGSLADVERRCCLALG